MKIRETHETTEEKRIRIADKLKRLREEGADGVEFDDDEISSVYDLALLQLEQQTDASHDRAKRQADEVNKLTEDLTRETQQLTSSRPPKE
jgi:hypothetical protein